MSWRKVTEADLIAALSQTEVDAYRLAAENDPVEPQLRAEVAYVRGVIRSAATRVVMSSDEMALPESLILPAMDHLRFTILMRMNVPANESRTKAYEFAVQLFRDIRAGEYTPESDAVADDSHDQAGTPAYADATPSRLLD